MKKTLTSPTGGKARGQPRKSMARAPPAPPRGGLAQPRHKPNRPVPAPRNALGPPPESYASVACRDTVKKQPRHSPAQTREGGKSQQRSTNLDFGLLVRKCHTVIKAFHHQVNVDFTTGGYPPMIIRMMDKISSMIRPAFPTEEVTSRVVKNAEEWGRKTLQTLYDYYDSVIEDTLQDLTRLSDTDWKMAFQVAAGWARKNFPKMPEENLSEVEALITAGYETYGLKTSDSYSSANDEPASTIPPRTVGQEATGSTNVKPDMVSQSKAKSLKVRPREAQNKAHLPEDETRIRKGESTPQGRYMEALQGSMSHNPKTRNPTRVEGRDSQLATTKTMMDDSGFMEMSQAQTEALTLSPKKGAQTQNRARPSLKKKSAEVKDTDTSDAREDTESSDSECVRNQKQFQRRKRITLT